MSQPLGQHFLKNQTALSRIVDAIELQKGATVIEIGPGKGALTIPLAQKCKEVGAKLIAVEKDAELADLLISESVNRQEQMEIITGDALRVLPELINQLTDQPINYSLIGNIPYYITGFLFRTIRELSNKPKEAVFLIQKEVAERVSAKEGEMNLLASSVQVWADAEMLFEIPPEDFDPPPQVYSAVIKLTTKKTQLPEKKVAEYYETKKCKSP
jgi:16S rRNA (adenine1518-N6/adenine1519-N6)-dimethyltransferase